MSIMVEKSMGRIRVVILSLCILGSTVVSAEESLTFTVKRYQIDGNTVLPANVIESAVAPFTGAGRSFADVQHALEALEAVYRKGGFGAVQVYLPEQSLTDGVVVFKIIETKVGKVTVSGNKFFDDANVRRALPALQEGQIPNTQTITRELKAANEFQASRQMSVSLEAGDEGQGLTADVKVHDESPWKYFAQGDNTGSSDTGRRRISVGVEDANLFDSDHALTVQATTSPDKASAVDIFGFGYRMPLNADGEELSLFGGHSSVNSGALGGIFNVTGKGNLAGAHVTEVIERTDTVTEKLSWGLDWRRFDNATTFSGQSLPSTDYTVTPATVTFSRQSQSHNLMTDAYLTASGNLTTGTSLGVDSGRPAAANAYLIWRFGGNIYVSLPDDFTLHTALNGQYTNDALVSSEQFGIGGAQSVRGYGERAASNDRGETVNIELIGPNLVQIVGGAGWDWRLMGFADNGYVARNNALPGETVSTQLWSVGWGNRIDIGRNAAIKVDFGRAMRDGAGSTRGEITTHVSALLSY